MSIDLTNNEAWDALMANAREAALAAYRERDQQMIGVIEAIEGRVPTNQEIMTHGACAVHQDGREEWKWRGRTICVTDPGWPRCGSFRIFP